jgi:4-hydroxythreonine-4-phosphate dehydrogenase
VRPLVVTMGEPAGIGGEIVLSAFVRAKERLAPFAVIGDATWLETLAQRLGLSLQVQTISSLSEVPQVFSNALPVLHQVLAAPAEPGKPDARNAPSVIAAIDRAVDLCLADKAAGMVTNPIHKATLYAANFTAPGHTEYLAQRIAARTDKTPSPVMMLIVPGLRVVPVTIHLSLADAIRALSSTLIEETGRQVAQALREDFAIAAPRLVVAALNPHAGEDGTLGTEERDIVAPAVEALQREGIAMRGPLPADTLFHAAARASYDAALCLYHDQALIPLKTIDFEHGVNVTLGLPIVRTSPDHGTAFDIAGQGRASPESFIAACTLAARIAEERAKRQS